VINNPNELFDFGEILAKAVRHGRRRPLLLACANRDELARAGESDPKLLLKLSEDFPIRQQTRLAKQTHKVTHKNEKRFE
jgi:hypothetical protein